MMDEAGTDTSLSLYIYSLAMQVLTRKYFKLNNQLQRQKQHTAMGTNMPPNYTIIFMHYLERNILSTLDTNPKCS